MNSAFGIFLCPKHKSEQNSLSPASRTFLRTRLVSRAESPLWWLMRRALWSIQPFIGRLFPIFFISRLAQKPQLSHKSGVKLWLFPETPGKMPILNPPKSSEGYSLLGLTPQHAPMYCKRRLAQRPQLSRESGVQLWLFPETVGENADIEPTKVVGVGR